MDGRRRITFKKKHVAFIDIANGVAVLRLCRSAAVYYAKAIECTIDLLPAEAATAFAVSVPGKCPQLRKLGFVLSGDPEFAPRLFCKGSATTLRFPAAKNSHYWYDGVSWRRKRECGGWSRPMRGSWAAVPLGFEIEINSVCGDVRITPMPGIPLVVSGSEVIGPLVLTDNDQIFASGQRYAFFSEAAGREQLPDWLMQTFVGGGWGDGVYTRGCKRLTRSEDGSLVP